MSILINAWANAAAQVAVVATGLGGAAGLLCMAKKMVDQSSREESSREATQAWLRAYHAKTHSPPKGLRGWRPHKYTTGNNYSGFGI